MTGGTERHRTQSGAAAIEFAFIVPLLLLLTYGVISYGYMLSFRQGLSQGAAEGARAAAISPLPAVLDERRAGLTAVNEALASYSVVCSGVDSGSTLTHDGTVVGSCSVTVATCAQDATKSCVTVALDYLYQAHPLLPSVPGVGAVLPTHLSYSANARMN